MQKSERALKERQSGLFYRTFSALSQLVAIQGRRARFARTCPWLPYSAPPALKQLHLFVQSGDLCKAEICAKRRYSLRLLEKLLLRLLEKLLLRLLEKHFYRRSEERRVGKECRSRWSP